MNSSVQSAFEQASRQSARVAESLRDAASRGANPEAILRDGQQMLDKTLRDGERLFNPDSQGRWPCSARLAAGIAVLTAAACLLAHGIRMHKVHAYSRYECKVLVMRQEPCPKAAPGKMG